MNKEEKKTMISTMLEQHRVLQKDLTLIKNLLSTDRKVSCEKISQFLEQFAKDLNIHLELENGIFYPALLKEMKDKDQDTSNREAFIVEMKNIEKIVVAFLRKYKDAKVLEEKFDAFKKELLIVIDTLNLRIESEEELYQCWGYLK